MIDIEYISSFGVVDLLVCVGFIDYGGCINYGINNVLMSYYGICSLENWFYSLVEIKYYSLFDDVLIWDVGWVYVE